MKKSEIRETESKLVKTYGIHNQTLIACEEFGELIQATCKMLRGGYGVDHLIEEIADAEIMMEQLEIFYSIDRKKIDEMKKYKLQRQLERIRRSMEGTI